MSVHLHWVHRVSDGIAHSIADQLEPDGEPVDLPNQDPVESSNQLGSGWG